MRCRSGDGCPREAAPDSRFCPPHAEEIRAIREAFAHEETSRKTRRARVVKTKRCAGFECPNGIAPGSRFCLEHRDTVVTDDQH